MQNIGHISEWNDSGENCTTLLNAMWNTAAIKSFDLDIVPNSA